MLSVNSKTILHVGHADIVVNSSCIGGQVRQSSILSFVRICGVGHMIPPYQSEMPFTIFSSIPQRRDVAVGKDVDLLVFGTNKAPNLDKHIYRIRDLNDTSGVLEPMELAEGYGVTHYGHWYAHESDNHPQPSSLLAGKPGGNTTSLSMLAPTGTSFIPMFRVYTATGTPQASSAGSSFRSPFQLRRKALSSNLFKQSDQTARAERFKDAATIASAVLGSLLLV